MPNEHSLSDNLRGDILHRSPTKVVPMPRDNTKFSYSEILLLQRAVNCLIARTADVLDRSPEADKEASILLIEELSILQNRIQSYLYSPYNIIP